MEPIRDITQNEISEVLNNPVDQAGNKIKLRSVSHENLVRHLKNIPYKTMPVPKIDSSKINLPKEAVEWSLTPKQYMAYVDGARKPINVKETMIENMRKHSETVSEEIEITESFSEVMPTQTQEIVVNEVPTEEIPNVGDIHTLDVEKTYEEIHNIRQQVLSKKVEADQAQKEADESDKEVQELGVQYTEAQKQFQDAKTKNMEVKKKVLLALSEQSATLANTKQQYQMLIDDANKRKEQNQNKIAEMNPKIKNVEEETMNLNNDTARTEEFLNAIYSNNIVDFPYVSSIEDEKVRRIA